jgi:hypothetical protein
LKGHSTKKVDYGDVGKVLFRNPSQDQFETPIALKISKDQGMESDRHQGSTACQTFREKLSPKVEASKFLFTEDIEMECDEHYTIDNL